MKIHMKAFLCAAVVAACSLIASPFASAGTILKLDLGGGAVPDLEYTGGPAGVLSTSDDGDGSTSGDQNTGIDFLDFLGSIPDIELPDASYTLSNVTAAGPASVFGSIVVQQFTGGSFQLYDDMNTLLLDVALLSSSLAGPLGPPATGAVFSTTFGTPVGGTLASQIAPGSIAMSISLSDVNGGAGLSVTPLGPGTGTLDAFLADATKTIAAEVIPEPASALMLLLAAIGLPAVVRSRR